MQSFRDSIDKVEFYTKSEIKEINRNIEEVRKTVKDYDWTKTFPHLSRDCGGDILNRIVFDGVTKVKNDIEFASNSVFCEWAYVIDLDTNKLEIYDGFNKNELTTNDRFHFLEPISDSEYNGEYHPVKIVKSYDLDNLPDEDNFVTECDPNWI